MASLARFPKSGGDVVRKPSVVSGLANRVFEALKQPMGTVEPRPNLSATADALLAHMDRPVKAGEIHMSNSRPRSGEPAPIA